MNPQSVLATIAEVAIAIAGFGGVIAAIASVTSRGFTVVQQHNFGALLLGSIMVVAFSIVPQILGTAGLTEAGLWTCASGLHALYLVAVLAWRSREMSKAGATLLTLGLGIPVSMAVAITQIANAIWFQTAWVYLLALLALVLVAFGLFPRLLSEIWSANA